MKIPFYLSEESLGFMTVTAYRSLNSTLRRKFKKLNIDLTPEQWGVLVLLWERGAATQDELAAALCVDKSTMSRVLSSAEDKGFITREVDPTNERKKIIRTAEKSLQLRKMGFEMSSGVMQLALTGISQQEAQTCIKVLAAIKNNLRS
ncbi:MAG: MarR family transcriptional regulator [Deltaproteobacteria bacterium]|jgi:DNA-binding MarR family transcriptional regulator|nr:MarR family transcriptional regulator [Deltaproteobacteria bacterium]